MDRPTPHPGDVRGFSVVELIVVLACMLVVIAGTLGFFGVAARQTSTTSNRTVALDNSRDGFERLTRELRQSVAGSLVNATNGIANARHVLRARTLDLRVWIRTDPANPATASELHTIRYTCAADCTRTDLSVPGAPAVALIGDVTNSDVFTVRQVDPVTEIPAPASIPLERRFVEIRMERTVPGNQSRLVLRGGAVSRNCLDDSSGVLSDLPCEA